MAQGFVLPAPDILYWRMKWEDCAQEAKSALNKMTLSSGSMCTKWFESQGGGGSVQVESWRHQPVSSGAVFQLLNAAWGGGRSEIFVKFSLK